MGLGGLHTMLGIPTHMGAQWNNKKTIPRNYFTCEDEQILKRMQKNYDFFPKYGNCHKFWSGEVGIIHSESIGY